MVYLLYMSRCVSLGGSLHVYVWVFVVCMYFMCVCEECIFLYVWVSVCLCI